MKNKVKKTKTYTYGEIFPDPDIVCQSEYRAIHDVIVDGVFDGLIPEPDYVLTELDRKMIISILRETLLMSKALLRATGDPDVR